MLMNDTIMFDRYYCIKSTKHSENENIGALYLEDSRWRTVRTQMKELAKNCFLVLKSSKVGI